jgi:hypothetical protein
MENENDVIGGKTHDVMNGHELLNNSHNTGEVVLHEEENTEDHAEEVESVDYSTYTKIDFATLLKNLTQENDVRKADKVQREIKTFLDDIRDKERHEALKAFMESGGTREDFSFKGDAYDLLIDGSIKLLRDRKIKHAREIEAQRNENLAKKKAILDSLRVLVDADESADNFNKFKQLQIEWKQVGGVPPSEMKTLWANYHALVDRYYDHRNIYFELKELDRKKNLESKVELCSRVEKLAEVKSISEAVKELNELHNEFKHIGPVPLEDKEQLWQRFKAASDAVYGRRDSHVKELNQKLATNLEAKNQLVQAMQALASFQSDRIKEWNSKTQEAQALQKQWGESGPVARAKAKDINKQFWSAFKSFFHTKAAFFKKLDDERQGNLNKKRELIQRALDLRNSEDNAKAINEVIGLQKAWKEIGPVQDKLREKIFAEFKEACDHFFNQRRDSFEKADKEQEENLTKKNAICTTLEGMIASGTIDGDQLKELVNQFNAIGFVPKKAINSSRERFNKLVHDYIFKSSLTEEQKEKLNVEVSLLSLKNDPEAAQKIYAKEQILRKRISKAENDIAVLRNNLEFFGRSKNAEKMKEEFNTKITAADTEIKQLKAQLKVLRSVPV